MGKLLAVVHKTLEGKHHNSHLEVGHMELVAHYMATDPVEALVYDIPLG